MPSPDLTRTLIFGNGGSGKTTLADRLAKALNRPAIHLDDLRWEPGNYGIARNNQLVVDDALAAAAADEWLMEGVYGWLAKPILPRATTLVWLDLPEAECLANVKARGIQGNGSEAAFDELLAWIADYRLRDNSTCFNAHARLYEAFEGDTARLRTRREVEAWLAANTLTP
jgi:adenylate kinase family enzyme